MKTSGLNRNLRRWAPLALIAAAAIPAAALGQDPAGDQYSPNPPSGGTGDANLPPSGNPGSGPGSGSGSPNPIPTSGSGVNPTDTGSGPSAGPGTPSASSGSADPPVGTTVSPAVDPSGNKAERTLDKFAAEAQQGRDVRGATADTSSSPTSEVLRSDASSGSGMGVWLWIVMGATLLWAVASGVASFRRRDTLRSEGSQPA